MCDHNDVTNLEINMLQASDGFTRYKCKHCGETIKKDVGKDVEFNRSYKRHYNLCVDHENKDSYIPTYKNSNDKMCCNWCGVEVK